MATQPEIQIEKGVPIPAPKRHSYPLAAMEVGDSFWTEADGHTVGAAIAQYGRKYGKKFTRRSESGGVRVRRVA